jgi:hypothetical protein
MTRPRFCNSALKWIVFTFVIWVAVRGAQRTPEIASRLDPGKFYDALVGDSANAAIMKERHVDFSNETLRALDLRRTEAASNPESLAGGLLISRESLDRARERETARWYRENVNSEQARFNLERQQILAASKPAEPILCQPAQSGSAAGEARP